MNIGGGVSKLSRIYGPSFRYVTYIIYDIYVQVYVNNRLCGMQTFT